MSPLTLTLEGKYERLEPLTLGHTQALHSAGRDEGIWRHLPIAPPRTVEATREWIQQAIDQAAKGTEIPFAIISTASGAPWAPHDSWNSSRRTVL